MDISNDWRLLNDTDSIKGEYLVAMTSNEIIELYPELKHCELCWDKLPEERISYNQIWFINQKRDTCICDKCYQELKEYLDLKETDDLYYESRMFKRFVSQEEQRNFHGSDYIEFQFCKMKNNTPISSVLSVDNINNRELDSLYISDYYTFEKIYGKYFDCGIYTDLECGSIDLYGINYYIADILDKLISEIEKDKPKDYNDLLDWLREAKKYNGFYILGV